MTAQSTTADVLRKLAYACSTVLVLGACAGNGSESPKAAASVEPAPVPPAISDDLHKALHNPHRTPAFVERDQYRHPYETLKFFDVQPDMTVVEIWPGSRGWYTEILAPYLKEKGTFYAAQTPATAELEYYQKSLAAFKKHIAGSPEAYSAMQLTELLAPDHLAMAPAGTADRVLTFRSIHNWVRQNQIDAYFTAVYEALKPGGILGVVQHRAAGDLSVEEIGKSGYVPQDMVVQGAEKAGLKLLESSEINANPADTANHPKGVWTLPPTLRLGELDREKYAAIGESDRMTLKFIKPE